MRPGSAGALPGDEVAMIKDVMVRLDGTSGDGVRLAVVNEIAEIFESHITGLFFNVLPSLVPDGFTGANGDAVEAAVFQRLAQLEPSQSAPVRCDRRRRY